CCCCRIIFNEADLTHIDSILETEVKARGFQVLFLPKFHYKLNFIEQVWRYAKRCCRIFPILSRDADLERNVIAVLEEVSVVTMCRHHGSSTQCLLS
ncbi:hypothetical protein BD779DRAFT_1462836, partial [Infundibulicybe gibba]